MEVTSTNDESVVGEECHIISKESNGPRHNPSIPSNTLDEYSNLILLCRIHHKMIDDHEAQYPVERLHTIKSQHEQWVAERLKPEDRTPKIKRIRGNIPTYLPRVMNGKELFGIISGACGFHFDHEELNSEDDVELIAVFLQNAQDWGDIGDELESGERVKAGYALTQQLNELAERGFWVFGGREERVLEANGEHHPFPIAILQVLAATNPEIISIPSHDTQKEEANSQQ